MIRRPAALLLAICLGGLAAPGLVSAAPPQTRPVVTPAAPSPPAARSPAPVPAPAASTAVTAPVLDRSSATPAARGGPAAPASPPPVASVAVAHASPTDMVREPLEVPIGADVTAPGWSRGGAVPAPPGTPAGLPETTTLMLVALGILAAGCATGLTVLARHASVTPPDDAAILAAATRRRLQQAPMLPWDDPVLAGMRLDRHRTGSPEPSATGDAVAGRPPDEPRRGQGGWRPGSRG